MSEILDQNGNPTKPVESILNIAMVGSEIKVGYGADPETLVQVLATVMAQDISFTAVISQALAMGIAFNHNAQINMVNREAAEVVNE